MKRLAAELLSTALAVLIIVLAGCPKPPPYGPAPKYIGSHPACAVMDANFSNANLCVGMFTSDGFACLMGGPDEQGCIDLPTGTYMTRGTCEADPACSSHLGDSKERR